MVKTAWAKSEAEVTDTEKAMPSLKANDIFFLRMKRLNALDVSQQTIAKSFMHLYEEKKEDITH